MLEDTPYPLLPVCIGMTTRSVSMFATLRVVFLVSCIESMRTELVKTEPLFFVPQA